MLEIGSSVKQGFGIAKTLFMVSSGGKLLKNQTIVNIALELNDGCWASYCIFVSYCLS
jgi:hypothetical protein